MYAVIKFITLSVINKSMKFYVPIKNVFYEVNIFFASEFLFIIYTTYDESDFFINLIIYKMDNIFK